jgi:hypothetical protein
MRDRPIPQFQRRECIAITAPARDEYFIAIDDESGIAAAAAMLSLARFLFALRIVRASAMTHTEVFGL